MDGKTRNACENLLRAIMASTDWVFENRPVTVDSEVTYRLIELRVLARELEGQLEVLSDEERQAQALRTERWGRLARPRPPRL